jgi:poly(A) polymerase
VPGSPYGNDQVKKSKSRSKSYKNNRHALSDFGLAPKDFSRNALHVANSLVEAGYEAYIVGGAVRDLLLGLHPKDFDVATSATPEQIKRVFRRSRIIGRRFQIVHVYMREELIEVTTFRAPSTLEHSKHQHADASGRLLRDNVYGTLEDDVWRRDFTVNALYYDASTQEILDFCGGLDDVKSKTLKLMGDPLTRYQEDPVRFLRAVRFKSKLGFSIEAATEDPLYSYGHLLDSVPAARLFDEILKMFIKGHGHAVLKDLLEYDLLGFLFPSSNDLIQKNELKCRQIIEQAMLNTDKRLATGKTVSPVFFFAVMLWAPSEILAEKYIASGTPKITAWAQACQEVFSAQQTYISIPKRVGIPSQNVVMMQPRFEITKGRRVLWLISQARFRAAFDLMLLRSEFELVPKSIAEWWTRIQTLSESEREELIFADSKSKKQLGATKKRSRSRKKKSPAQKLDQSGG